jgi:hypothetical protein
MRALNENERLKAKKRILLALDATVGGEQYAGHLAGLFPSKRNTEIYRMICGEMVRCGPLEVAGVTEDKQVVIRRKVRP